MLRMSPPMKNVTLILTFMMLLRWAHAYGQPDTIIEFDVPTQTFDTVLPVSFDTTVTFDKTSFSIGSLGNTVPLSLILPSINLFSGSHFSDLARAELFYNVTDYPI